METVFAFRQCQISFWNKASDRTPKNIIHSGVLCLSQGSASPVQTNFKLTKTHLFQCESDDSESQCKFEVALRWIVLQPFEERGSFGSRFGFSLCTSKTKVDFFVKSQHELSQWLDFLEEICILTDITDDFAITKQIGSGGQSTVFLGESQQNGEKVAIKMFEKHFFGEHPRRITALAREIEVLRELKHPQILKLYRVYEDEMSVFLVTEFIPGQDLFKNLATHGTFSLQESSKFIEKFLDVLDYLREMKVLHRDLKPENIMLPNPNDRSEFTLIDFGFSMQYMDVEVRESCGSPGYIAPEIILDHCHGPSIDLYSAGIIFFVLLVGYSPFYSQNRKEVVLLNAQNLIEFNQRWKGIDQKYIRLIRGMTSTYPEFRISVKQLKEVMSESYKSERKASVSDPSSFETVKLAQVKLQSDMHTTLHPSAFQYI